MKKNDWVLLAGILGVALVCFLIVRINSKPGAIAIVKLDGEVVKELPLDKNTTIVVQSKNGGENTIEVKNGYVRVISASCPDHYCMKHKKINKSKETIVCLPNELVVEIQSDKKSEFDAITN